MALCIVLMLMFAVGGGMTTDAFADVTPYGSGICLADAKLCPDGTAVTRTGPNCEFPACPTHDALPAPVPAADPQGPSGVIGTITISHVCNQALQSEQPFACGSKPYQVSLVAEAKTAEEGGGSRQVDFSSDENGTFKVDLPPGEYLVSARQSGSAACQVPAYVAAGRYTQVNIACRTGD